MALNMDDVTAALQNTRVSPNGVTFAGKSLKLDTEEDAKPVIEAIEKCTDLQYLNLEGNTLGVDAAKGIAKALEKHPELKRAQWKDMFTGRMKTEIPKALEYLGIGLVKAGAKLTELDLSDNAFGPIGVQGLAALLRSSSCFALEELRLNNNGLGITGGKLLAEALTDCYYYSKKVGNPLALKVFIAGRNRLENPGAKALSHVFKLIGTLEEVAMPQNGIYHVGISALSEAFTHNKNLQVLNLNDNTITHKGAAALAKALPNLQKLITINFGDCLLKTKGVKYLAAALKDGHVDLKELLLDSNEIKKEGGLEIAQAMANKSKLKTLVLDGNQFGEEGEKEIKDKLKSIGKINTVSIEDNEDEDSDDDTSESSENESDEDEEVKDTSLEEKETLEKKDTTVEEFEQHPTVQNFIGLGDNKVESILEYVKKDTKILEKLDTFIPLIMKVSQLSNNPNADVAKESSICASALYKELFSKVLEPEDLSLINNSLLVNLGLIKSEDKKYKPSWDLEGCLMVVQNVIEKEIAPESTRDTLKIFMQREISNNGEHLLIKRHILSSLGESC